MYRLALYSPDTHIAYDGRTPDERGIGGGETAVVRLLKALARLGHQVTAYVNCDVPGIYDEVEYCHFQQVDQIESDILIAISTSGKGDFSPLAQVSVTARLKILWVQGVPRPTGFEVIEPDFVYVGSNFLREVVVRDWGIPSKKVFVCYNGIEQELFRKAQQLVSPRDPFAIAYLGHPAKGLDPAIQVLRQLRERNSRFHLDIYAGYETWGQSGQTPSNEPGVAVRGLLGQRDLIPRLFGYGFCLALQEIPEGWGTAVQEAKRAGMIVVASKVGAYVELIRHAYDGFLIEEPCGTEAGQKKAVDLISSLVRQGDFSEYVRRNAMATPWDWDLAAKTCTAHWDHVFGQAIRPECLPSSVAVRYACPKCHASLLPLPDGFHCETCGRYYSTTGDIACFAEGSAYYRAMPEPEFHSLLGEIFTSPWREVVWERFSETSPFLYKYITDESRGHFHFLFDLSPDSLILDLGTGYGAIAASLSRRCRVVALDNTFLRLAFLRERCRQDSLRNIAIVYGDALELPFEARQFDLVTMVDLPEWAATMRKEPSLEELQMELLREAYRILRPGGCVYLGIESRYGFKYVLGEADDDAGISDITYLPREDTNVKAWALGGVPYRVREHSKNDYEALLRRAGFQRIQFYAPYPDHRLWSALVPLESIEASRFYMDYFQEDFLAGSRAQQIQDLEKLAPGIGTLQHFMGCFAILARRES